jgi:hypothetical protein
MRVPSRCARLRATRWTTTSHLSHRRARYPGDRGLEIAWPRKRTGSRARPRMQWRDRHAADSGSDHPPERDEVKQFGSISTACSLGMTTDSPFLDQATITRLGPLRSHCRTLLFMVRKGIVNDLGAISWLSRLLHEPCGAFDASRVLETPRGAPELSGFAMTSS